MPFALLYVCKHNVLLQMKYMKVKKQVESSPNKVCLTVTLVEHFFHYFKVKINVLQEILWPLCPLGFATTQTNGAAQLSKVFKLFLLQAAEEDGLTEILTD